MKRFVSLLTTLLVLIAFSVSSQESGEKPLYLSVRGVRDGNTYLSIPVSKKDRFAIQFLHSYDRVYYRDMFLIKGMRAIIHVESGGRSNLNGQGFFYENFAIKEDGTWEITAIDKTVEEVTFIMGSRSDANHKLLFKDEVFCLSELIPAGTTLKILVEVP